jgi:hypothetical protein
LDLPDRVEAAEQFKTAFDLSGEVGANLSDTLYHPLGNA